MDLLKDSVKYFVFDEINIDNWLFKMYYKVSMVICMTGATVGIASQYFGDPIRWEISKCLHIIEKLREMARKGKKRQGWRKVKGLKA